MSVSNKIPVTLDSSFTVRCTKHYASGHRNILYNIWLYISQDHIVHQYQQAYNVIPCNACYIQYTLERIIHIKHTLAAVKCFLFLYHEYLNTMQATMCALQTTKTPRQMFIQLLINYRTCFNCNWKILLFYRLIRNIMDSFLTHWGRGI
jgi:hypothetical protein